MKSVMTNIIASGYPSAPSRWLNVWLAALSSNRLLHIMGYLYYKNYIGSVEYDDKADCLRGRVLGIRDSLMSYEGMSLEDLRKDFQKSVDLYIEACYAKKKEPIRPYSRPLKIRLNPDLYGRAAFMAEQKNMTLHAFVENAVRDFLQRLEKEEI